MSEQDNEGVKNLREALKERDRLLEETRERLAEYEAAQAQEASARRNDSLRAAFKSLGLDEKAVSLYPADAQPTADSVAEWASTHGIASARPAVSDDTEGLNRLADMAYAPAQDSFGDLATRVKRGTMESYDRRTVPTAQELADHERDARDINRLHQRYAKEVQAGRAQPLAPNGRGGPTDPPYYANRAQQAIDAGL